MSITRRAILSAAASAAAFAQNTAPRAKGPRVWLDMDQKELDDAYTQSVYAPNLRQLLARYASNSELTRRRIGPPRRMQYGQTAAEGLDLFSARRENAPILVFIHGGAWRNASARDYAFPAELFVHAGAHYIAADFTDVDASGGSLMPMAQQVRQAVAWVYRNARTFGGNPNRLYIVGHSSGGHLTAAALVTDWEKEFQLPPDVVQGALCCSGMFDLKPVRLSVRSSYVKFTDEMEQALSPQRHIDRLHCPVTIAYGTLETPEFQRQSREFAAAVQAAGKSATLLAAEGYNHFEVLETLANPYGILGRAVLEMMKLS
jgi:arylformamidase